MIDTLSQWWTSHHAAVTYWAAFVGSAIITLLTRIKTAQQWLDYAGGFERLKTIVYVIRAMFPDPAKAVEAVQFYLEEKKLKAAIAEDEKVSK